MIIMQLVHHTFTDFRMGDVKSSRPEKARGVPQVDLEKYAAYKFYELLRSKGQESLLQYQLL